jgi:zinc/manganese transport system substrate-binding protein
MRRDLAVLVGAAVLALAAIPAPQAATNSDKLTVLASFSILPTSSRRSAATASRCRPSLGRRRSPCLCADPAGCQDRRHDQADRRQRPPVRGLDGSPAAGIHDARSRHRGQRRRHAAAPFLPPASGQSSDGGVGGRFGNATAGIDPHAWQRVDNAEIYMANIRDGLIRADPEGRATYEANAAAYTEELARPRCRHQARRRDDPARAAKGHHHPRRVRIFRCGLRHDVHRCARRLH